MFLIPFNPRFLSIKTVKKLNLDFQSWTSIRSRMMRSSTSIVMRDMDVDIAQLIPCAQTVRVLSDHW